MSPHSAWPQARQTIVGTNAGVELKAVEFAEDEAVGSTGIAAAEGIATGVAATEGVTAEVVDTAVAGVVDVCGRVEVTFFFVVLTGFAFVAPVAETGLSKPNTRVTATHPAAKIVRFATRPVSLISMNKA